MKAFNESATFEETLTFSNVKRSHEGHYTCSLMYWPELYHWRTDEVHLDFFVQVLGNY